MKVNLNKQFKNLSGEEMKGQSKAQVLAEVLSQSNKGNSIKLYAWALKFFAGEEVEMDDREFKELKAIVAATELLPNMFKAQIELELETING